MGWDLSGESWDVLPSNPSAEHWLTACCGRRHLNCLIMDLGYDSLSHPERNSRWVVSQGTITLPSCIAVCICVYMVSEFVSIHVFAPFKLAHHSSIPCSQPLCSTEAMSGITVRHLRCQYALTEVLEGLSESSVSETPHAHTHTFPTLELSREFAYDNLCNRQSRLLHVAIRCVCRNETVGRILPSLSTSFFHFSPNYFWHISMYTIERSTDNFF